MEQKDEMIESEHGSEQDLTIEGLLQTTEETVSDGIPPRKHTKFAAKEALRTRVMMIEVKEKELESYGSKLEANIIAFRDAICESMVD